MHKKINTYFAMLVITIVSSGAALQIVNFGTTQIITSSIESNLADTAALLRAMPKHRR